MGQHIQQGKLLDVVLEGSSPKDGKEGGKDDGGFDADVALSTGELRRSLPGWMEALGGEPALSRAQAKCPLERHKKADAVDLKVPITITDELSDEVINGTALLNLASGEIGRIEYADWDIDTKGHPFEHEDYEFTSGTLSNAGKDVEFRVDVNRVSGQYSVSASELLEIKVRAAALFAGVSGKELAASTQSKAAEVPPARPKAGGRGRFH